MNLNEIIENIQIPNKDMEKKAWDKINQKTKPLGSLGMLEEIAVKICAYQESLNPKLTNKSIFTYAADHGIAAEGVSAFPQEVTSQMVFNFLNKGAAINVFCDHNNIDLTVIDIGVNYDFEESPNLINKKIAKGTKNFLTQGAMTEDEAVSSIQAGIDLFMDKHNKKPMDIIGLGEMGIGNTTSSSAIISCITGRSVESTTGRGTGIDDERLRHKINIIQKGIEFHKPDKSNAIDILRKIGGFEIGGIMGTALAAAYHRVPVILDGIISTTGGLLAYLLCEDVSHYLFSAHRSVEQGQKIALDFMKIVPLLDLNMRLGEGTGAALAMNIFGASVKVMTNMASFEEAGVSGKS